MNRFPYKERRESKFSESTTQKNAPGYPTSATSRRVARRASAKIELGSGKNSGVGFRVQGLGLNNHTVGMTRALVPYIQKL